ncbi:MAG: hypothetical protein K6U11_05195 [bacterium]|nr:hypothetical protein [bacterium]
MRNVTSAAVFLLLLAVLLFSAISMANYVNCQHLFPDEALDFNLTLRKSGLEILSSKLIGHQAPAIVQFMKRLKYEASYSLNLKNFDSPDRIYFPFFLSTTIILS